MAAKRVISRQHLDVFTNGQTHADVVKFIETLNTATVGISLRQTCNGSSVRFFASSARRDDFV